MKSMFLVKDQDKADNELDSYGINLNLAIESFLKGNFEDAISYHENVIQSLYELNKIKNNKRIHDKVQFILGQIKAERDKYQLIEELRERA